MNTMNNYCFFQIKRQQNTYSKTLNIVYRILVVICVYLVFGLLFNYVYANTTADNNIEPYQAQHDSICLLPNNDLHSACIKAMQIQKSLNYKDDGYQLRLPKANSVTTTAGAGKSKTGKCKHVVIEYRYNMPQGRSYDLLGNGLIING